MADRQYIRERERREKASRATGVVLTVAAHAAIAVCCIVSGFTYLDPPPPEREMILIDFEEPQVEMFEPDWEKRENSSPEPSETTNLVQASEAQHEGTKLNEAQEAQVDDFGDVETPAPEPEKEIDQRALFRTAKNKAEKDTLAPQTAEKVSEALKAGHAQGNTETGAVSGQPKASIKGRTFRGSIPEPQFAVQNSGTVVVTISVDRNGDVLTAVPGAQGTTVTDKALWQAAREAALKTHFNIDADADEKQYGTITYIFKLKR